MLTDFASLRARLVGVRERIARAAGRSGRDPSSVRLVAVSKTFTADHVRAVADCGHVDFGENKVQEALAKMDVTADLPITWHLVGHLQSNKAGKAGGRFDVVHSIDGAALAGRIDDAAGAAGRKIRVLIQVDLAGEPTKHGARVDELSDIYDAAGKFRAATLVGLMTIPPATDDPERARPYFRALRDLKDELLSRGVAESMLQELSMGMSGDFEVAIEEGATLVRVEPLFLGAELMFDPALSSKETHADKPGSRGERSSMNVSPLDLRQQRFRTTLRGFDKVEVASFLAAVADDYEQALRETDHLRQDLARMEVALNEHREHEKNLKATLMTAQRLADDIKQQAEHEAQRIIREAEGRSDLLLEKTQSRLEDVQREIDGLKLKRRDVETTIEATIQTLRNTLEFVHEQEAHERDERILLHRPRLAETQDEDNVADRRRVQGMPSI